MLFKSLLLTTALAFSAAADGQMNGTWKLNTAKSKYTNMPMPKDLTVTYATEGTGWRYSGQGTSATGEPISPSFTYMKDGEDIKMTGFPFADTLVLRNGNANVSTGTFKRDGERGWKSNSHHLQRWQEHDHYRKRDPGRW